MKSHYDIQYRLSFLVRQRQCVSHRLMRQAASAENALVNAIASIAMSFKSLVASSVIISLVDEFENHD